MKFNVHSSSILSYTYSVPNYVTTYNNIPNASTNITTCNANTNNNFCAIYMRKTIKHDLFVTCSNCNLDFHVHCIDVSDIDSSNVWFCRCRFVKTCNDELPFSNTFIDLNCKLQKGLKITHLNIQSLINKIDYVNLLLHNNDIDVLCITETRLSENIDDNELVNDYNFCRLDRQIDKTHGGVLCYFNLPPT